MRKFAQLYAVIRASNLEMKSGVNNFWFAALEFGGARNERREPLYLKASVAQFFTNSSSI